MNPGLQAYVFSEVGATAQSDKSKHTIWKNPSYITQAPLLCGIPDTKKTQARTRLQHLGATACIFLFHLYPTQVFKKLCFGRIAGWSEAAAIKAWINDKADLDIMEFHINIRIIG